MQVKVIELLLQNFVQFSILSDLKNINFSSHFAAYSVDANERRKRGV